MNNMKKRTGILLTVIVFGFLSPAFALEGESIVFNPKTGNYVITYKKEDDGTFRKITYIPATKINPTLKSQIKLDNKGEIHYGYTLISGKDSQQNIVHVILDPISSVKTPLPDIPLDTPPSHAPVDIPAMRKLADDMDKASKYLEIPAHWEGSLTYSRGQKAFRIGWSTEEMPNGMHPGGRAVFGLNSRDLPGIIQVKIEGIATDSQDMPGEQAPNIDDGGFGTQYFKLVMNDFVPRNAAVPAIAVPTPFNAAILLERIQTQLHTWIGMKLLDSTFSSQLDRYFAAASTAFLHNQPKAGKEHIETLRKMLKKEHEDADKDDEKEDGKYEGNSDDKTKRILIDRLAARVLDFNLKYVLKRVEGKDKD